MEKVEVTPVIGLPQLTGWSHVVTNRARTLTFAFAVSGQHASNVGRDLVDELESIEPTSVALLYATISKLQKDVQEKNCSLHLVGAMVSEGRGIFLATHGLLILHRQGKLGKILQADETLQVIEGSWQPDDLFILLTESAIALYNEIEQKINQGYGEDVVITSLVPSVHSRENSSLDALAFVRKIEVSLPEVKEEVVTDAVGPELAIEVEVETPKIDLPPLLPEVKPQPSLPTPPVAKPTTSLGLRLKTFFSTLGVKLLQLPRPFSQEVYVTSHSQRSLMRRLLLIGLPLLSVIVGLGYYLYQRQSARAAVNQVLATYDSQIQSAKALSATDPIAAREQMQQILTEVTAYKLTAGASHGIPTLVDEKIATIQSEYDAISGLEAHDSLEPFFDLRLVQSDFIASQVRMTEDGLLFVDEGKKQLIKLSLPNKQHESLTLETRESVKDILPDGDDILVLGDGVHRYANFQSESSEVVANDEQVQAATAFHFFNDAFYILSPDKQNIFRYRPNEEGEYEIAVGWIRAGQAIDFGQVQSFQIDGDVWLTTKDGQIYRYNSGAQTEFAPTGLATALAHPLWLVTNADTDNLYLLEPKNKRIVILTKNGEFLKEIQSSSLVTATGLAINEDETKAYVISGSLVYEVPL